MDVKDIEIAVKGFWYPEEVAAAAGVPGLECTCEDGRVVIHPRPRALSGAEMERVVAREVEEQQLAKAEAEKAAAIQARQEKFAAFKAKATQGKATSADLTEIVLTLVEAQLE